MVFPKRQGLIESTKELIVVGSMNPVKLKAAEEGFGQVFEKPFHIQGIDVSSGVSEQPMGSEETHRGAANRLKSVRKAFPEADYWVGIEGGVAEDSVGMFAFAWVLIEDKHGQRGQSQTGTFYLPPAICALVKDGLELGKADDQFFSSQDSKLKGGSVGILTRGKLDRKAYYEQAVLLALIPFVQQDLY